MPRQTILKSFAFIPAMADWETKDPPVDDDAKIETTVETDENSGDDGFYGGIGDLIDVVDDTEYKQYNIRSYYIPLACMKSLFYVFVPFVAMGDDFKSIAEEDLELFQLTPTINFTLSLKLSFHGDKNQHSVRMFEKLSSIRFLKDLKLGNYVSVDDFKQVAGLHFLTTLELFNLRQVSDEALTTNLHGLVNLEKLVIRSWEHLTSQGCQQIPLVGPNLRELVLADNPNLGNDAFAKFGDSPSFVKNMRVLKLQFASPSNFSSYEVTEEELFKHLCSLVNLERIDFFNFKNLTAKNFRRLLESYPKLIHLTLTSCNMLQSTPKLLKVIGRKLGQQLQTLVLDSISRSGESGKHVTYLARYFKSLNFVSMSWIYGNLFDNFKGKQGYYATSGVKETYEGEGRLENRMEVNDFLETVKEKEYKCLDAIAYPGPGGEMGGGHCFTNSREAYREEETEGEDDDDDDGEYN